MIVTGRWPRLWLRVRRQRGQHRARSLVSAKLTLTMLGLFAGLKTNRRGERQLEGIALAKAPGGYKGRRAVDLRQ